MRREDVGGLRRSAHLRERLAVGRPLPDADLLLSRVDGTPLSVREYSREFSAQRNGEGLKAIPLTRKPALNQVRASFFWWS